MVVSAFVLGFGAAHQAERDQQCKSDSGKQNYTAMMSNIFIYL